MATDATFGKESVGAGAQVSMSSTDGFLHKGSTATGRAGFWLPFLVPPNLFDMHPSLSFSAYPWGGGVAAASTSTDTYAVFGRVGAGGNFLVGFKNFGFLFRNNNGVKQLFATASDGTTQTLVSVPIQTDAHHFYHCELVNGSAYFYIDNANVAVISTNVPAGSTTGNFLWGFQQFGIAGTGADYHYTSSWVEASWDLT